jgi:hypothetical protein
MLNYMLVRHTVKDFTSWKRIFDEHLPKRIDAGLTDKLLLRGADKPNEVIILYEIKDIGRAKKFAETVDLRETMERAGVIDKPDIYYLTEEKAGVYKKASGF